jgi:hypothetical protein
MSKGMSTSEGTDFVGNVITDQMAGQDKRKAIETIRHEKEEKQYKGAIGEKYDDVLPSREGRVDQHNDRDE